MHCLITCYFVYVSLYLGILIMLRHFVVVYRAAIFRQKKRNYYQYCGWIWKYYEVVVAILKNIHIDYFYYIVTVWCIKFILSLLNCQTCVYMSVYINDRRKYLKHLLKLQSKICCLVNFGCYPCIVCVYF